MVHNHDHAGVMGGGGETQFAPPLIASLPIITQHCQNVKPNVKPNAKPNMKPNMKLNMKPNMKPNTILN